MSGTRRPKKIRLERKEGSYPQRLKRSELETWQAEIGGYNVDVPVEIRVGDLYAVLSVALEGS